MRGIVLGFDNDKDAAGRRRPDHELTPEASEKPQFQKKKKKGPGGDNLGHALRSAYQRTIDEQIPPDLLDLLGKLG